MLNMKATLRNTLISELLVIFVKKSHLYVDMLTGQYAFSHERSKLSMTLPGKTQVSSTGVMQRAFVLRIAHQNGSLFLSFLFNLLYFFQPDSYHLIRIVSFDHKRKKIFTIKQCL